MMRTILEKPVKITQGTIFSNARSCSFSGEVYGIIISNRCDIENRHHQTVIYLPIVPLKQWVNNILFQKLRDQKAKDADKYIKEQFQAKNISYDVLKYVDRDKLLKEHFKKQSEIDKIKSWFEIKETIDEGMDDSKINEFLRNDKINKDYNKGMELLINNNYNGYFYIDNVDYYKQEDAHHFVVLLNEVQTLPSIVAEKLVDEINLSGDDNLKSYFGEGDTSMALSTVMSPFIECIIQMHTALFRVGIDRADFTEYDSILKDCL